MVSCVLATSCSRPNPLFSTPDSALATDGGDGGRGDDGVGTSGEPTLTDSLQQSSSGDATGHVGSSTTGSDESGTRGIIDTGTGGACRGHEQPGGDGPCPEQCNGGCADGTCRIDCLGDAACQAAVIDCPPGWPCSVWCSGDHSCSGNGTQIHCGDNDCTVRCDGPSSCQQAGMFCGAGACEVLCVGTSSCQQGVIACGRGPCTAACAGERSSATVENCVESCHCIHSCL